MKQVLILTPAMDGRNEVFYTHSLVETVKMGISRGVNVIPFWRAYDALVQRVRNDLLADAVASGLDAVWVDRDIGWQAADFFRLLAHPVDVVGGAYRKKHDREEYPIIARCLVPDDNGLIPVDGIGTGFLKMSARALRHLWDCSPEYTENGQSKRWAFDVSVAGGVLVSEDNIACHKLAEGGMRIYLDPLINCDHVGPKKWSCNFSQWAQSNER